MNPFANWKVADVEAHNERVNKHENNRSPSRAQPEPAVCHEPVAEAKGENGDSDKVPRRVRIASYRRRLLDFDNLAGGCKYFCDCCTYSGLIPGDSPEQITLEVSQHKVKTKAEERTEIEVI